MMITFYKAKHDGSLRYYSVNDRQSHLFSKYSFSVIYGIDQGAGRERVFTFRTRREMDAKLREIFNERVQKGYKVLYSYAKKPKYKTMFKEVGQRHA
ncbi:MAG: hypothetical protein PQJ61_15240 [Spirochaetales bacterium]|uniref:WGR domain-containing protein n=1 Tax=Candidatus Thalassospirochaeta sargassi TaxID=3119039 RepID=A0AAJ1IHM2_9SPIO|nr:hypothetical protein [Spirochaetales bacterium]